MRGENGLRVFTQKVIAGLIWGVIIYSIGSQKLELALAVMMAWMVMSWPRKI